MHTQVTVSIKSSEISEILVALLSDAGYEGFEEREGTLIAFIPTAQFSESTLAEILDPFKVSYTLAEISGTNWNKQWEENFEPVIVDDFCTVRAHFHHIPVTTPYDIVITPKMSFGTGHHATTQMMISAMRQFDFVHRTVLDFGTGTGILAILASMLGARAVLGIDNEEWAFQNAVENVERNSVSNVAIQVGSLEVVTGRTYDIILANINRNVLLQHMSDLHCLCGPNGRVLMSGLLSEDRDLVLKSAQQHGFVLLSEDAKLKWVAMIFSRP